MARRRKVPEDTKYFKYHNVNPKGRHTGDCVIRALATVTNQSWRKVLDDLVEIASDKGYTPLDTPVYERYLKQKGFIQHKQLKHADNTKYTGREFIEYMDTNHPETQFIIAHIGYHHITCFVDLDLEGRRCYDIWDPTDRCVGKYWTK